MAIPPTAPKRAALFHLRMLDSALNKVVRLTIPTSTGQLEQALGALPHGVRFGVLCELEEAGEAFRYNVAAHCAYYVRVQSPRIVIWRWSYVATELEAHRLGALIMSLDGPMDGHRANRLFERATHRSVSNPNPADRVRQVSQYGDYPVLVPFEPAGAP